MPAQQLTLWGGEEDARARPSPLNPASQMARQIRERHYLELVEESLAVRRYLRAQLPSRFESAQNCSHQRELRDFADRIDSALARHARELHDRLEAHRAQQQDATDVERALDSLELCRRIEGDRR